MKSHLFTIEGDRESGKYVVIEWKNGNSKNLFEIKGRHKGGLKEAREIIGEYLKEKGYSFEKVFWHQCIKPGRKINPFHAWTVNEYLLGAPLNGKCSDDK